MNRVCKAQKILLGGFLFSLFLALSTDIAYGDIKALYDEAKKEYHTLFNKRPGSKKKWINNALMFEKIFQKSPQGPYADKSLYSAGSIYFEQYTLFKGKNNLFMSEKFYSKVASRFPKSNLADDALYKIGKIHLLKNDNQGAYSKFKIIIDKYPSGDLRKQAEKELKKLSPLLTKNKSHKNTHKKNVRHKLQNGKRCVFVIDPGHGGKDGGAKGYKGTLEKKVTLDIAKRLKKIIRKQSSCKVIMTREKDVYISLARRTAIGNASNATLFISIHANASRKRSVHGIET